MSDAKRKLMISFIFAVPFAVLLVAVSFGFFKLGIPAPITSMILIASSIIGAKLLSKHINK